MWQVLALPAIWAQVNPFEAAQRHLNRPLSSQGLGTVLMFGVAIGTIWALLTIWERRRRRHQQPVPVDNRPLFDILCERHQLGADEVTLLRQRAVELSLPEAALVFVDPRHLQPLTARDAAVPALISLGQKLFGAAFAMTAAKHF